MMFKHGQKIEALIGGFDSAMGETWKSGEVMNPPASCLPRPGDDWHLVRFSDGWRFYVHETRLRPLAA